MLVTNNKSGLYNGVNQQSAEHRNETQVEECINAYPTIANGLLKRNPTETLTLSDNVVYDENMYVYEYDRGLVENVEEKYSLQITNEQMQIIDVNSGAVKTKLNGGIVFNPPECEDYFKATVAPNAFSALTIKDTTFIVNKSRKTSMVENSTVDNVINGTTQDFSSIDIKFNENIQNGVSYAPVAYYQYPNPINSYWKLNGVSDGSTYINIDGIEFDIDTSSMYDTIPSQYPLVSDTYTVYTMQNYIDYIYEIVSSKLREYKEIVSYRTIRSWWYGTRRVPVYRYTYLINRLPNGIRVVKNDGNTFTTIVAEYTSPTVPANANAIYVDSKTSAELGFGSTSTLTGGYVTLGGTPQYEQDAFIWVKASNPTSGYNYTVTINYLDSNDVEHTITKTASATTTEAVATALKDAFDAELDLSAVVDGSIVKVSVLGSDVITSITCSDTYGNQACVVWSQTFASHLDLPKSMPFDSIVNITGTSDTSFNGYWLKSVGGVWSETIDPTVDTVIDKHTMPHIMVRKFDANSNPYFEISPYDDWTNMRVGDYETNALPSFIDNEIRDIFFFKNRLGFITKYSCVMSEVANYNNFFRTTVTTLLESDRIDANVDTTKAIELEYATYIEDSLLLFSDKAQFKLEGARVLSPSSIQISQTSAYEINKNVRPVFMNDKVFFCARRGDYTTVMQYFISGDGRISEAIDITAQCDNYIPADVVRLSGSSINNMLFLTAKSMKDTVFVYKYYDTDGKRMQSAWFKWQYNADIYNIFSLGRNLNFMLKRYQNTRVEDWILGSGIWDSSKFWTSSGIWFANEDALTSNNSFEVQKIHPNNHNGYFVDASNIVEDTDIITSITRSGTFGVATISCNLLCLEDVIIEPILIDSSAYTVTARTESGEVYSSTSRLTVPRTPTRKITSIEINPTDADTTINGVSVVYSSNQSSELVFNSDFSYGLSNWTLTGTWTSNYGTKELGSIIPVTIDIGEWVLMSGGKPNLSGSLKFKTCQISSEDGSDFNILVENLKRKDVRIIQSKYTVDRKPMIYGDSKDVRLKITNNSDKGFKINSVTFEGNFNSRSKRT